jgi:Protein of unknown function (DUF2958)
MKLLTHEVLARLPALGGQTDAPDPVAHVKFFTPDAGWTWYATEGSPEGDDFVFFGYVKGIEAEWGTFTLGELRKIRGALGLPVERDRHFRPRPISEVIKA